VPGVDRVIRRPHQNLALAIAEHWAALTGEWLFLDTDVIVQQDVRDMFSDLSWDIAVAARKDETDEPSMHRPHPMPHNAGVVFSRSQAFWVEARDRVKAMPLRAQKWIGIQQAMCDLIHEGHYRVRVLPRAYNWAPRAADEDVSERIIVHYKGDKKGWMLGEAA
jgi:lipopolysaccharide biosynthesis glycosyltransferase